MSVHVVIEKRDSTPRIKFTLNFLLSEVVGDDHTYTSPYLEPGSKYEWPLSPDGRRIMDGIQHIRGIVSVLCGSYAFVFDCAKDSDSSEIIGQVIRVIREVTGDETMGVSIRFEPDGPLHIVHSETQRAMTRKLMMPWLVVDPETREGA